MIEIELRPDGDYELSINGSIEEWGSLNKCVRYLDTHQNDIEEELKE